MAIVHAVAAACAAGLVFAIVQLAWVRLVHSPGVVQGLETSLDIGWVELTLMATAMPQSWLAAAFVLGAALVVTSLAVCLALKEG
jgi:hypothetical protein